MIEHIGHKITDVILLPIEIMWTRNINPKSLSITLKINLCGWYQ